MKNFSGYEGELQIALDAQSSGDYSTALRILQKLADESYPPAIGNLGCMFQLGLGVEVDGVKAVKLLKKALDLGFGPAAHNLGTIYGAGIPGVERDDELRVYYREKAAELGVRYTK